MKEILSQNEIDELLSVFNDENEHSEESVPQQEASAKHVKPLSLSPESVGQIKQIHKQIAQSMSSELTILTNADVEVSLTQIKRISSACSEVQDLPQVMLKCYGFNAYDQGHRFIIAKTDAYVLIDRMLGGNGSFEVFPKLFTEIEEGLFSLASEKIIHSMQSGWKMHKEHVRITPFLCAKNTSDASDGDCLCVTFRITVDSMQKIELRLNYNLQALLTLF